MRLDVTPLGAASKSVAAVAKAVVDYLQGGLGDPGAGLLSAGGGAAHYYGDSPEGPGRWVGAGAAFQRLNGTVQRDAFQRLLEGRHPHSGARLITARGSSQRAHLAVGAAARFDDLSRPLYDIADTAALLGVSKRDVNDMIETTTPADLDDRDRSALRTVQIDGETFVPDSEISRLLEVSTWGEIAAPPPVFAAAPALQQAAGRYDPHRLHNPDIIDRHEDYFTFRLSRLPADNSALNSRYARSVWGHDVRLNCNRLFGHIANALNDDEDQELNLSSTAYELRITPARLHSELDLLHRHGIIDLEHGHGSIARSGYVTAPSRDLLDANPALAVAHRCLARQRRCLEYAPGPDR